MRMLTCFWIFLELLLLTNFVLSRTLYVVRNGRLAPVADIDDSRLSKLSSYDFSPKRFLKISKRRQSFYSDEFEPDVLRMRPVRESPFYNPSEDMQQYDDPDYQFRRSVRNQQDDRAAEDYYNEWIMSNIGK